MSRTTRLSPNELAELRTKVRNKYSASSGSREVRGTSYKEGYEELRLDILHVVPDAGGSLGLDRLRKLFYYTDPSVCPPSQMKHPSFGKDFLEALRRYIAEDSLNGQLEEGHVANENLEVGGRLLRKKTGFRFYRKFLLLLLLIPIGILISLFLKDNELYERWREDFGDNSKAGLEKAGWQFWDFDSVYFARQLADTGYLTLYTLKGDFWVKPGEEPYITNFLYRRLDCECCVITFKFKQFYPSQIYQQAAILLMDKVNPKKNNLRIGFTYWEPENRDIDEIDKVRGFQVAIQKNGEIIFFDNSDLCFPAFKASTPCPDTIHFRLMLKNQQMEFQFKENEDWQGFKETTGTIYSYPFKPYYLGIGAFQGQTDMKGKPLNADTIPVLIDFIKVAPCTTSN
ncbi:MAG TPA: hypothetical protein PKE06_02625 [Flavilitoribacter sp.]|nr:hypothetical protein [Flavilitoribacter sp.]HMQ90998.1 hypothetical protein [Flavilitoribacter sp.]